MTYHRHFTAKKHRPRWFRAKNHCAYCTDDNVAGHYAARSLVTPHLSNHNKKFTW